MRDEPHHLESNAAKPTSLTYQVNQVNQCLEVRLGKGSKPHAFHYYYLRDACSCPKCVNPSTKQKNFQTADIPPNILVKRVTTQENGDVQLEWQDDIPGFGPDHTTTFPRSFFPQNWSRLNRILARYDNIELRMWGKAKMEQDVKWIPYDSYMSSDATLHEALTHLYRYGLIFLSNVPSTDDSVINIGTRIGPLRDTFYGRTWEVKSVPDAKNVAYTHQNLGLHMDLLYMQNPPGLQLLHCMRATCAGGNSLFADSFRAVRNIKARYPAEYHALHTYPVTYHYRNAGQHYHYSRPTVELDQQFLGGKARGVLANVNWSPPFQAPFEIDTGSYKSGEPLRAYLKAASRFAGLVQAEHALFELKLEEGQCVVFNNRRVLHARRAFEVGEGERLLRGAYVDSDAFKSKLRVLTEEFKERSPTTGLERLDVGTLREMREEEMDEDSNEQASGEEEPSEESSRS